MQNQAPGIVLIEDNPDDELLARRALRRLGLDCEYRSFDNGPEALAWLQAEGAWAEAPPPLPRLLLLDLKLPEMDGHEILRRLRRHPRTRHVPVVILSTSGEPTDIRASYEEGANSYLRKAIDFDEFARNFSLLGQYWMELNQTA